MNNSQKFLLFLLIVASVSYVYFSFFNKDFKFPEFNWNHKNQEYTPINENEKTSPEETEIKEQNVKIFVVDNTGTIRSVNRSCNRNAESSCFEYAIKELVKGPSKWEKSKGFSSEIPQGTRVLSIRETQNSIMIDLSKDFETGGGTDSTYYRMKQVIKTANANTKVPVYLYINGNQARVIGGDGIMVKQPLSEN